MTFQWKMQSWSGILWELRWSLIQPLKQQNGSKNHWCKTKIALKSSITRTRNSTRLWSWPSDSAKCLWFKRWMESNHSSSQCSEKTSFNKGLARLCKLEIRRWTITLHLCFTWLPEINLWRFLQIAKRWWQTSTSLWQRVVLKVNYSQSRSILSNQNLKVAKLSCLKRKRDSRSN